MVTLFWPTNEKVRKMFVPALPFVGVDPMLPSVVADNKPLPLGNDGGCSFARLGAAGGVGALDAGPALEEGCFTGFTSVSISIGVVD